MNCEGGKEGGSRRGGRVMVVELVDVGERVFVLGGNVGIREMNSEVRPDVERKNLISYHLLEFLIAEIITG